MSNLCTSLCPVCKREISYWVPENKNVPDLTEFMEVQAVQAHLNTYHERQVTPVSEVPTPEVVQLLEVAHPSWRRRDHKRRTNIEEQLRKNWLHAHFTVAFREAGREVVKKVRRIRGIFHKGK